MNGVKLLTDIKEINELYNFIQKYPLNYPNYSEWLIKCKRELELGYKKALVYKNKDNKIIGNLIFQPHKQDSSLLELKNGHVEERYRKQGIFNSLIITVEDYAKKNDFKKIIVDTNNQDVVAVIKKMGFKIEAEETLYTSDRKEIILTKDLNPLELKLI